MQSPKPWDFSKALYTFDIEQNELSYGFQYTSEAQVRASLPDILSQFSQAVHKEGARVVWVHNTGPVGCLPYGAIVCHKSNSSGLDKCGCIAYQNEIAQDFNRQLKDQVSQLRKQLPSSSFTYVDVYSAKYKLMSKCKSLGVVDPNEFWCGSCFGYPISGNPCKNPSNHVSWHTI